MKPFFGNFRNRLIAAAFVVGGTIGASAHADVLNIPVVAGMLDPTSDCQLFVGDGAFAGPGGVCYIEIPISIPAGRTIEQVSVIHGSFSFLPSPYVLAGLWSTATNGPIDDNFLFYWESSDYVPDDTVQRTHLMTQNLIGTTYPDAFTVDANRMYTVDFNVSGATFVSGLQVTYK